MTNKPPQYDLFDVKLDDLEQWAASLKKWSAQEAIESTPLIEGAVRSLGVCSMKESPTIMPDSVILECLKKLRDAS